MEKGNVILGAGIAGIGAAYKLGSSSIIYEARNSIGGHCDNFLLNGFRFDYAVHLSFTTNQTVRNIFDMVPYHTHNPLAKNYSDGYWTKHPLQNNMFPLPIHEKIEIIKSFLERKNVENAATYKEWLLSKYGEVFSNRYPERYTRKYWGYEANQLTTDWISNRIYTPTIDELLYGSYTDETPNTYYAKEMRYPQKGGYKAFFEFLADNMDICLDHKVISIDHENKVLEFSNGKVANYSRLISSIPLPDIITMLRNVPASVMQASDNLKATSVVLVSIGFKENITFPSLWFYIYDEDIPFARIYSPSMKSSANVPSGKSSLQFEAYLVKGKTTHSIDQEFYKISALRALDRLGIASQEQVEVIDVRVSEYANVIFKQNMEADRMKVRGYLSSIGIETIGRFGEWDYLWSDQSFLSGYNIKK